MQFPLITQILGMILPIIDRTPRPPITSSKFFFEVGRYLVPFFLEIGPRIHSGADSSATPSNCSIALFTVVASPCIASQPRQLAVGAVGAATSPPFGARIALVRGSLLTTAGSPPYCLQGSLAFPSHTIYLL